ncbi:hypothetical protein [Cupriavidus agavae]|uniref:BACON domain-containing protein n=1 Tax=Cupriavidus agavae TaxID=1001822 RepID=A0A4Q7S8L0_9BURK|nr:hypothetical protein [Cupriavidus agavae]RZT41762.1 hypothetical protein EV147_0766 [Cupriavidus agavae]
MFETYLRGTARAAVLAAVATTLHGCGGGDDDKKVEATPNTQLASCSGMEDVQAVTGYPVYTVNAASYDACDVAKHYVAGYAIVSDEDIDPWAAGDKTGGFQQLSPTAVKDPTPGDELVISTMPAAAPADSESVPHTRFVLARSADTNYTPVTCEISGDEAALQSGLEKCLAPLRAPAPAASQSVMKAVSAAENTVVSADPDPKAWTMLGKGQKTYSTTTNGHKDWWHGQAASGNVTVNMSLYRLNSVNQVDYYLAKIQWSSTPYASVTCSKTICGYYNNDSSLKIDLKVNRAGKSIRGEVVSYAPTTLPRTTTTTSKIGANLTVGEKGGAGVSSEVSQSYSYQSVSIVASNQDNILTFSRYHATDTGSLFSSGDLFTNAETTVGNVDTPIWALFQVPAGSADVADDVSLNVTDLSGNFGFFVEPGLFLPSSVGVNLYGYRTANAISETYSPPMFGAVVSDGAGGTKPVTLDTENPIRLKPEETFRIDVKAGDASTPYRLQWQVTDAPDWLTLSPSKGSDRSGNQPLVIRVAKTAPVGSFGYIKINTTPKGAAPSVRDGDLHIPVLIVQ